jgi:transcriptional regulator with XRE-family HTH domain
MFDAKEVRERILELLMMKGINASKMMKELGYSQSVIPHMLNQNSMPSADKIARIASFLSVSVEYLLGLEPQSHATALDAFKALPPDAKKAFLLEALAFADSDVAVVEAAATKSERAGRPQELEACQPYSPKELWNRVRKILKAKGMTIVSLQKYVGASKNFVSEMEKGNSMPSADKLAKIALYLGVSADYLLGLETRGPETLLERFEAMPPGEQERFLVEAALGLKGLEPGKGALVLLRDAGPAGEA